MDALGWQALLAAETSPSKSLALLRELGSFHGNAAQFIARHPMLSDKERQRAGELFPDRLDRALAAGVRIVEPGQYPEPLRHLGFPPAMFCWGDFECAHDPCIGIVGTRAAGVYGKAVAIKFAEAFARAGVTVVSGGALGIDAAAHKGALSASGKTIAVLAGGIEQVYPAVHGGLFTKIRANGCLVSQHAVGSRPSGYRFLTRNNLIAGLSSGVVVIEAPERSGAISTVHAANDQGKQVFVVPANIDNANFRGSHGLIRDGATLVDHPDQVLCALGITAAGEQPELPLPSGVGVKILAAIAEAPLSVEFIVDRTGLDTAVVMSELTMLEIEGRVLRDGGKYMVRP